MIPKQDKLVQMGYSSDGNVFRKKMTTVIITIFPSNDDLKVIRRISTPTGQVVDMKPMLLDEIEDDELFRAIIREENKHVPFPLDPKKKEIIPIKLGTTNQSVATLPEKDTGPVIKLKP